MTEPIPPRGPAPSARPPQTGQGRRRKAAVDSRIAASGIAACAALGMVLGMGLGQVATEAAANSAPPAAAPPPRTQTRHVARQPQPEIIVIQRRYVPGAGGSGSSGSVSASSSSGSSSGSAPTPAPAPAPAPPPPTSSGGS